MHFSQIFLTDGLTFTALASFRLLTFKVQVDLFYSSTKFAVRLVEEALINSAPSSWHILFALPSSTNPPHSLLLCVRFVSLTGQKFCTNLTDFILSAIPPFRTI
ncbi:hypothetical protein HMPREF1148_0149 [Selenomonas sp. FOBRC6]|nr:hypothetical protein HMPREF1148_0149 [Selenomonas sp. FOBRC6]